GHVLCDRVFAGAAVDDFEARAAQSECAFRHQEHAIALIFAEPAAWCEVRARTWIRRHRSALSGWKAPGGGQAGFTYAKNKASSIAHRISHLARNAACAASCSPRVRACLTTQARANSASSGACVRRPVK